MTSAGRVPPHNLEAEESLLGAMLLSRDAILAAVEARVESADFYKPAHTHVFDAIMGLYGQGEPVDPVSVADELRRVELLDELGGRQALLRLQGQTPASANAWHFAAIVHELALFRRLAWVGGEIAELGYQDHHEVREQLDRAEQLVFEVATREVTHHSVTLSTSITATIDDLDGPAMEVTGASTGYTDVDDLLLGLQGGAMYVVGARPGMGKTSFAIGAAVEVAMAGRPALVFSMEMDARSLTKRILAGEARVDLRKILKRDLSMDDWDRLSKAVGRLADAPLEIDDNPYCTVRDIAAQARRLKARRGDLGVIVVDYVQLMEPTTSRGRSSDNREREVAEISRGLKVLALELDCPIIACAQLNRGLESRSDKRPMLADLRETGALENDADVVIFIFRDELYNPESEYCGTAEIIVSKNRNGPTGVERLAFLEHYVKFANMARG